ncbi:MAG: hypothetical protein PGN30_10315 [Mycolicibacterium neoaurum]|uniref:hypothetical protein n=1 Tax=Mycolicibacterium neoaurum TaxID=1795 RepID=UPI002FFCD0A0
MGWLLTGGDLSELSAYLGAVPFSDRSVVDVVAADACSSAAGDAVAVRVAQVACGNRGRALLARRTRIEILSREPSDVLGFTAERLVRIPHHAGLEQRRLESRAACG